MNIWVRRTYFLITILIFIVIAVLLVFYASGWRYNRLTNRIGQVGALIVDTQPNGASVYLDENKLKKNTPTTNNSLIADQYQLKISKTGYFDWIRDININQTKTTRIPLVYLLKKQNNPIPLLSYKQINSYTFSPDLNKIAIISLENLEIIDLNSTKTIFTKKILPKENINNLAWNNKSNKIIYNSTIDGYITINLTTNKKILLNSLLTEVIDSTYWSTTEENIIYILSHKTLNRINIFQKTVTEIMKEKNIIFNFNHTFFNLANNELQVLNESGEKISFINIPNDANLSFLNKFDGYIPIINKSNNKAYFYNISKNTFETINETVTNIKWINDKKLLLSNNHEIWYWDKAESNKEIILRTSDDISDADWLLDGYYTIYTTHGNTLNIIQSLDTQKNNYSIELKNIKKVVSKYKDNIIYLIADNSLYKLEF